MRKDMKTSQKTPPSSLCSRVEFHVPESWEALTQEQLRTVLKTMCLYRNDAGDYSQKVKTALLMKFCGIEVDSQLKDGFLCRERKNGRTFLLDPELLPSMCDHLAWIDRPEEMEVRIAESCGYKAVDFRLQELPFGGYLVCENHYQGFLVSHSEEALRNMACVLYGVPEKEETPEWPEEVLMGVMLWWMSAKRILSKWFPHFLKPGEGGKEATQEGLMEMMRAQLRMLSKGDVTKEQEIREKVDTWTAFAELDALAEEAEEIRRKYGK